MKRALLALLLLPLTASALLPNPTVCYVTPSTHSATLDWDDVPGAAHYSLFRQTGPLWNPPICASGGTYGSVYCRFAKPVESWYYLEGLTPGRSYAIYVSTDMNGVVYSRKCAVRTLALPT